MQSKISPLAAVAAVVAFTAAPAFALDAHLVPIPTGGAVDKVEDVTGDELLDVAPDAAALPSDISWPELNGFPRPFPGADEEADDTDADEASTTTWSTWCPDPTVFTWGSATISVSTPTWVTLTDCPLSSSSSVSSTWTVSSTHACYLLVSSHSLANTSLHRPPLSCLTHDLTPTHTPGRTTTKVTLPRSHRSPLSSHLRTPSSRSSQPTLSLWPVPPKHRVSSWESWLLLLVLPSLGFKEFS